jgi:cupin fold WbuC family metalloprotein
MMKTDSKRVSMSKKALKNPTGDLFKLTHEIVETGIEASRKSSRKRIIYPVQRNQESEVQRLLNFMQPGTYVRPHRHPMPHATESIVVLQGKLRFFTFDAYGKRLSDDFVSLGPLNGMIDIEPGVWHSFLVLEKDTIIFECKKGPYDSETDKEFAEWAPEEGSADSQEWMKRMNEQDPIA